MTYILIRTVTRALILVSRVVAGSILSTVYLPSGHDDTITVLQVLNILPSGKCIKVMSTHHYFLLITRFLLLLNFNGPVKFSGKIKRISSDHLPR